MTAGKESPHDSLTAALEAVANLLGRELDELHHDGLMAGQMAHSEIEHAPTKQKSGVFYRHFLPLRRSWVSLLALSYRRYFRLALAHPRQTGRDPHEWALGQLYPAIRVVLEWIRDWYMLACDGENQYVQRIGTVPFVPGQTVSIPVSLTGPPPRSPESWRAPAWLFAVSIALVGIGRLKTEHVPVIDSEERLGAAHTRLLLKGARRLFLWELGAEVSTVRNEEIAAAGAVRVEAINRQRREPNKRKGWQQRLKLYSAIQKALSANPGLEGMQLCAELDKRHAPPLFDWKKAGEWPEGFTWKEAWRNAGLRRKIRRVRQEAMKAR